VHVRAILGAVALAMVCASGAAGQSVETTETSTVPPTWGLVLEADECLTPRLREAVDRWAPEAADASVSVVVEHVDAAIEFAILRSGQDVGRRRFDRLPQQCPDRVAALSLAIAIALDGRVLERITGEPAPAPVAPEPVAEEPEPVPAPPDPPPTDVGVSFSVSAGASAGALPSWVGTGRFAFRFDWRALSVELGGVGTLLSKSNLGAGMLDTRLFAGSLDVCLARAHRRTKLLGCVGASLGRVMGEGRGFATSLGTTLWWGSVDPSLSIAWPIDSPVRLRTGVRGHVKTLRPEWRVVDSNGATRASATPSLVGLAVSLGVEFVLW
jgi:hypothetical protein